MISIIIKNFEFDTIIGVLDFERVTPQKVIINTEIFYEYNSEYLDYAKVSEIIKNILQNKEFEVLEDSLDYICSYLKNSYSNILDNMIVGAKIIKKY